MLSHYQHFTFFGIAVTKMWLRFYENTGVPVPSGIFLANPSRAKKSR